MKKPILFLISTLIALGSQSVFSEESIVYVQSDNATVRSEASFGAKVIAKVAKGQPLPSISKDGNWLKVTVDGKTGYISSFLVANQKPLEKQTVIKSDESQQEVQPSARRRASSFTSAAAARGLDSDKGAREVDSPSNFEAVKKMESVKVTPQEVNKFKETGK